MKYKYIIIGTSRSGKSTYAKKLKKETGAKLVDVKDYVYKFIKKEGIPQNSSDFRLLKKPYENLFNDLKKGKKWDILEIASDFPGEFLPKIISFSEFPIKLVYCKSSLEVCLERNRKEKRKVPENIIRHQNRFQEKYFRKLAKKLGLKLSILAS